MAERARATKKKQSAEQGHVAPEEQETAVVAADARPPEERRAALDRCIKAVRDGLVKSLSGMAEAGNGLREIQQARLYIEMGYSRWEDFCTEVICLSDESVRRCLRVAEFMEMLSRNPPIGGVEPQNESQVRAATEGISRERWMDAWEAVTRRSVEQNRPMTAAFIREVVGWVREEEGRKGGSHNGLPVIVSAESSEVRPQEPPKETAETAAPSDETATEEEPDLIRALRELEEQFGGETIRQELPRVLVGQYPDDTIRAILPDHHAALLKAAQHEQRPLLEVLHSAVAKGLTAKKKAS